MTATHRRGTWLLRRPSEEAVARVFCFPYSGVGASMYGRWPARTGDVELCPVQLPGRENRIREPHFGSYERLAVAVVDGLGPYLDRPFGLFGHCAGALVAFAVALELERAGLPGARCLFVSSQVAPHVGPYGSFLGMTDDQLRTALARFVEAVGGRPQPDLLDLGMETLRPDVAANRAYRLPAPARLACAVHAIGWREDEEILPAQMTGWAEYAAGEQFRSTVLDGGHYAFLDAPDGLLAAFELGLAR